MIKLIYIVTDDEGVPILASHDRDTLFDELNKYNGESAKIVENKKIEYSEFEGSLERIIVYEYSLNGVKSLDKYFVTCIEMSGDC